MLNKNKSKSVYVQEGGVDDQIEELKGARLWLWLTGLDSLETVLF